MENRLRPSLLQRLVAPALAFATVALAAAPARASDEVNWGFLDLEVPLVVGEVGSKTYDLSAHPDADHSVFVGNQEVKGGTFVGGGLGAHWMIGFRKGFLITLEGGAWGGRIKGAQLPWASTSTAGYYLFTVGAGYALALKSFVLHAAVYTGFDHVSFDVAQPAGGTGAATPGAAPDGTLPPNGYDLSRFDLRAGLEVGAHVRVASCVAVFARGTIDYDLQWRATAGIAFGGGPEGCK